MAVTLAALVAAHLTMAAAAGPALAHPAEHLATFDSFAEGPLGTEVTDGGITFFALDVHAPGTPNPLPPPHQWLIERADGTLAGMPGFTAPNALGCCGLQPGPSAAFGRIGEFRMTTGEVETDASMEIFGLAGSDSGTVVTLEAIRNGVVVATNSATFTRRTFPPQHIHLEIRGVEFDQLRVSSADGTAFPFFSGLIDTVRISNRKLPPPVCVAPPPPPPDAIFAIPGAITSGTPGDDVIYGTAGDDRISGLGGNDTVFGLGGDDQLSGGEGNDTVCGGDGDDLLAGESGDDRLSGDAGGDALSGGPDDDELFGGPDADRLTGGDGFDVCRPGGQPADAAGPPPSCDVIS
ncbi:MAG TPA: calcium-binding protein [Acidimicrobiales bacterium]|nr:calcium-binding protein [Acidimicrobiales bacterium]